MRGLSNEEKWVVKFLLTVAIVAISWHTSPWHLFWLLGLLLF